MNRRIFEHQTREAANDFRSFAKFVAETEFLSDDPRYCAAWFEAETVNAAALAEWEGQGRPNDWEEEWQRTFRADAVEVAQALRSTAAVLMEFPFADQPSDQRS
ncbi:hypothetical protein ACFPPF_16375 [Xenophilus aerolatus]|nr:hypothetical protein [Xenophilus aerolatus]